MELNEFAEIILFGENIFTDKLLNPEILSDINPKKINFQPKEPGRPSFLKFTKETNSKISFPNLQQIENETQRGYVLHFFANHELLAMEIMALVLLKFPDAPKKFRMGIANTILEEQKHMKLYLDRMKDFNVSFGEIPVNDFFWNCLSQLNSPLEFVTKMSMTFEQANLDYSYFYKELMKKIGDIKTSEILETVYLEEIGHVKHGVSWFNKWKDSNTDDWEFYVKSLKLPLTPARAKGNIFDASARIKAGLSENFIQQLNVFSASKGRPPNLYFFNPSCELEIARGQIGFTAPKQVKQLEEDLQYLMLFLARKDDIVFVTKKPSTSYLSSLKNCGFDLPEWHIYRDKFINSSDIQQDLVAEFYPWGWSPESIEILKVFKGKSIYKNSFYDKIFENEFSSNIYSLFSKSLSSSIFEILNNHFKDCEDILCTKETKPIICKSFEEVENATKKYISLTKTNFVLIKTPFSSSGQNMRRVCSENFDDSEKNWILKLLHTQYELIVEPWYDKIIDISYQSKIDNTGKFLPIGLTRFLTDKRGQYKATILGRKFEDFSTHFKKIFYSQHGNYSNIEEIIKETACFVSNFLIKENYIGSFGIDSFIYKDPSAKYGFRIKLLSEINPRFTMGRVSLEISKRIQSGAFAVWAHIRISDILKNTEFPNLSTFKKFLEKEFPIIFTNTSSPLIQSGVLITNDIDNANFILTILIVGKSELINFQNRIKIDIIKFNGSNFDLLDLKEINS